MAQIKLHKEKKTRKAKAKSCLYAAVSPTIFTRIMRLDSTKAMWDYSKEEYEGDEKIRGSVKSWGMLRSSARRRLRSKMKSNVDDDQSVKGRRSNVRVAKLLFENLSDVKKPKPI
ncbi:hypothetical protein CRG98_030801 [Punica granatum]|uniref:Uncharacterized protein n=1 Tax=Punica granatum TaxID=22663 RepID=A0A2I0IXU0_PUNGR|nr:hypothetical protein CRG98_030801 [Punica granatum]